MTSTHEPHIPSPIKNRTNLSCKAFSITLSVVSLIFLITVITPQLPIIHHSNSLQPSDQCTQSSNPLSCHEIVKSAINTFQSQFSERHPIQILWNLINRSLVSLDMSSVAAASISYCWQGKIDERPISINISKNPNRIVVDGDFRSNKKQIKSD